MTAISSAKLVPTLAGDDVRTKRIQALKNEKAALKDSDPTIEGSTPWTVTGAGVGLLGGCIAGAAASMLWKDKPQYGSWGLFERQMGTAMAIGIIGTVAGGILAWNLSQPHGDEKKALVEKHKHDVAKEVGLIDIELRALGA